MAQAATQTSPHRFSAHARDEGRHREHPVPGATSLQDAALIFAEHVLPERADAGQDLAVIVRDAETGEHGCFVIDLDEGEAEPCP